MSQLRKSTFIIATIETVTPFSVYGKNVRDFSAIKKNIVNDNWFLHTTKIICEKENKKNSIVVIKQGSENFININFYM